MERTSYTMRSRRMRRVIGLILISLPLIAEHPEFIVAGLRVMPERWNKEANFRKLDQYARQAVAKGAKVVITPEGFLDGYVANDQDLNKDRYFGVGETIDGPILKRVRELARSLQIYLAVGFPELRGSQIYNSVVTFGPDGN